MLSVLSFIIQIFLKLRVQWVVCDLWRMRTAETDMFLFFFFNWDRETTPPRPSMLSLCWFSLAFWHSLVQAAEPFAPWRTERSWHYHSVLWMQKSLPLCLGAVQSLSKVNPDKGNWWEAERSAVPIPIWNSRNVISELQASYSDAPCLRGQQL